jgi:competence protein ComFC
MDCGWSFVRISAYSIFFPWKCPGCSSLLPYPQVICTACSAGLPRIPIKQCKKCGIPLADHWRVKVCPECKTTRSALRRIRSLYSYDGLVRQMIRDAKYRRQGRYLQFFGEQMYSTARAEFPKVTTLAAVPLHRDRQWERTFNQAERLVHELSRIWGIPALPGLVKVQKTIPQSSLSGSARRKNLKDAFAWTGTSPAPRSVLLIDDVITTGATLEQCARTLRHAGVRTVYALTVARAVLTTKTTKSTK